MEQSLSALICVHPRLNIAMPKLRNSVITLLWLTGVFGCMPLVGASTNVPCSMLAAANSRFCVFVGATDGYLTIIGTGELHTLPGFPLGKYQTKEAVEAQLNLYLSALLHKQRLYEIDLPMPGPGKPPTVPAAAKTVSGKTMQEAVDQLKNFWHDCHECDLLITNALDKRLGELGMHSETPFFKMITRDVGSNILAFEVDPPAPGLSDPAKLAIGFDMGAAKFDPDGRLQSGAAVRAWISEHYEGRFWIASEISNHFNNLYRAAGFNSNVFVSLAGAAGKSRSVTITESSRIGRIVLPGDGQGHIDPAADKLAYLLLHTDQWREYRKSESTTPQAGAGGFVLCLPLLSGGACTSAKTSDPQQALLPQGDDVQRSLDYLSTYWLAERTADLQALGYGIGTSNEQSPPLDPAHPGVVRTAPVDLNVQKLAPSTSSTSTPQPLTIATQALKVATVNQAYQVQLAATGGTQPLNWTVAPALPRGLALNASSGVISGTPAAVLQPAKFTFTVTDSASPPATANTVLTLETTAEAETTGNLPGRTTGTASVPGAPRQPGVRKPSDPSAPKPIGFDGRKVDPAPAGTLPPPGQDWVGEYGVRVDYRPNQPIRVLLAAQTKTLRLGPAVLSASAQAGTDGTRPVGNGNINADWLWFSSIRRRLQLQVVGSTDATTRRILGGAYTDERRTGSNAHVDLEIFRDQRGFLWHVFADPRRESVSLLRGGAGAGGGNINTLTIGSGIVLSQWITDSPLRVALNAQTRIGSGIGSSGGAYAVSSFNGGLHRRLSNRYLISVDLAGNLNLASAQTPVFELPSFGGAESVRGFQMDDALGRKTWDVQSELWVPVPGTLGATQSSGILWFLRQNIRLAGFFDAGGAWDTSLTRSPGLAAAGVSSQEGFRSGTGAGVRFLRGPIVLKLDWAYGFGHGAFGSGHGRFYIGVGTNGTF